MKKIFIFILAVFTFTACSDDEDILSTTIKVKVINLGEPKPGVTVYLFDSNFPPESNLFEPEFASGKKVTDSNGFAIFELEKIDNITILEKQNTFYFAIFKDKQIVEKNPVLGKSTVTIKKGETEDSKIWY